MFLTFLHLFSHNLRHIKACFTKTVQIKVLIYENICMCVEM